MFHIYPGQDKETCPCPQDSCAPRALLKHGPLFHHFLSTFLQCTMQPNQQNNEKTLFNGHASLGLRCCNFWACSNDLRPTVLFWHITQTPLCPGLLPRAGQHECCGCPLARMPDSGLNSFPHLFMQWPLDISVCLPCWTLETKGDKGHFETLKGGRG